MLFLANLSHERLKEYLDELSARRWATGEEAGNRVLWRLTEEGREVLREMRKMQQMMEDFGLGL